MKVKIKIVLLLTIAFLIMILTISCMVMVVNYEKQKMEQTLEATDVECEFKPDEKSEDDSSEVVEIETIIIESTEKEEQIEEQPEETLINLGEYKLTAYCSCYTCCGEYALNRPKDENGNDIVYGASGERLISGVSIAVDPTIIPFGSKVIINGDIYVAHDIGGAIKGNRIDIYFNNHQSAWDFGWQFKEVYLVK